MDEEIEILKEIEILDEIEVVRCLFCNLSFLSEKTLYIHCALKHYRNYLESEVKCYFKVHWNCSSCFAIFGSEKQAIVHLAISHQLGTVLVIRNCLFKKVIFYTIFQKKIRTNNSFVARKPPKFRYLLIFFLMKFCLFFFNSSNPVLTEKFFVD